MHDSKNGKNHPESERSGAQLGWCLVDGDQESTFRARRSRGKTFGVSLAIEILLVAILVAAPLLSSGAQLKLHQILPPQLTFSSPWRERLPARPITAPTTAVRTAIPNPFRDIPISGPIVPARSVEESVEGPVLDIIGESTQGTIQGIEQEIPALFVGPPLRAQPPQPVKQPLKISEGVLEAQLISRIEPQYPTLARLTKTEGTVRLRAFISEDGRITSLDVISGHPLLVQAALDAVRQWRYRPTMLNGEPVEVETSITVIFRLRLQ